MTAREREQAWWRLRNMLDESVRAGVEVQFWLRWWHRPAVFYTRRAAHHANRALDLLAQLRDDVTG